MPGSYVEQMPYPCHETDRFMQAMEFVLPLAMVFAWLFPIAMTIRGIVREKEVCKFTCLILKIMTHITLLSVIFYLHTPGHLIPSQL